MKVSKLVTRDSGLNCKDINEHTIHNAVRNYNNDDLTISLSGGLTLVLNRREIEILLFSCGKGTSCK